MGEESPIIQGGEWQEEFYWGELALKLQDYLNWKQTWDVHFASGDFFQTEAISDSVRLAPTGGPGQYFTTGVYTSTMFDAGRAVDWVAAEWSHSETFYAVALEYRTGNTAVPDLTWSSWVTPTISFGNFSCSHSSQLNITTCNSTLSGVQSSRYIQYRAEFNSGDSNTSVALFDINLVYGIHALTGEFISEPIAPVDLLSWKEAFYTSTVPISTSLIVDILSVNGTVLISNITSGDSLAGIDASTYSSIKLRATLNTTAPSLTPEIEAWGIRWFVGSRFYLPIVLR